MDREALLQRLMGTFLEELAEHVRALNRDLLALEKGSATESRGELMARLFRAAHSLKGASRSVSAEPIEAACHRLEAILAGMRDGEVTLEPELFQLLFQAVDAIEEAGGRLRERRGLDDAPLIALLPRLDAAAPHGSSPARFPLPPPAPPAVGPTPLPAPAPTTAPASRAPEAGAPGGASSPFARIPAWKLDALLNRGGELLIARRRAELWDEELSRIHGCVRDWRKAWHSVEQTLGRRHAGQGFAARSPSPRRAGQEGAPLPRRTAEALTQARNSLGALEQHLERLERRLKGDRRAVNQAAEPLEDEIRRVRMFPFTEACEGLQRTARDLATSQGKEVELVIQGGEFEMDRSVLEKLRDPLLHLVRNALDHAIEPPAERVRAGKPPRGRVTLAAVVRGTSVEVTVEDDGRGLDLTAIREQARRKNLAIDDDGEVARLIFLPGFSTSRLITQFSGRGIGLDVVKHQVESVHGTVEVAFTPGQGTRFTLKVPLTLTTVRGLLISVGGQLYIVMDTNVLGLRRLGAGEVYSVENRDVFRHDGRLVPLVSLAATLGLPAREPEWRGRRLPVVILASGEREAGFLVDELIEAQEVTVRSLGPRLAQVQRVAGATVLPSGRIALILNAAEAIRRALGEAARGRLAQAAEEPAPAPRKRLLVVEDSVTTRSLEKSILEAAGYEVLTAVDGVEAWQILQEQGADLVVTDVEMPRMDGFALTETIRASKRFHNLGVVLLTALESDRDKKRGIDVGADAYLLKSAFNQGRLLDAITQLL